MEFHEITPEDGQWVRPLLERSGFETCEYTFANVYMWSHVYETKLAEYKGYVVARNIGRTHHHFLFPTGGTDLKAVIEACVEDATVAGKNPMFYGVAESEVPKIEALFPGQFEFTQTRDMQDYVYLATDLQELPGKKFQKKRNHVSRFIKEHPDYTFETIGPDNIEEVRAFNRKWCEVNGCNTEPGLAREHRAIEMVLNHYLELELLGGLIRTGGEVVAFCYGSRLSANMLNTQVEKAWHDVNGAYAIINRDFARSVGNEFLYINREEDLGEEGLRKAKLSYNPAFLAPKYQIVLKNEQ